MNDKRNHQTEEERKAARAAKANAKQMRKNKCLMKADSDNLEIDKKPEIASTSGDNNDLKSKVPKKEQKTTNNSIKESDKNSNISQQQKSDKNSKKSSNEICETKSKKNNENDSSSNTKNETLDSIKSEPKSFTRQMENKTVDYFKHLHYPNRSVNIDDLLEKIPDTVIHREIKKLGSQIDSYSIRGSINRCNAFLNALKCVIEDFSLNNNTESFSMGFISVLYSSIDFLNKCRPIGTTITAAVNYLKMVLSNLHGVDEDKCRKQLIDHIDLFLTERINVARESIFKSAAQYIQSASSVLVCSHSSLITETILLAHRNAHSDPHSHASPIDIFIVSSFLDKETDKTTAALKDASVPFYLIDLCDVPKVMPEIDFVLLGVTTVFNSGNVLSSAGTASIVNAAKRHNKQVIALAETVKFSPDNQQDSFQRNELRNPNVLVDRMCEGASEEDTVVLKNWRDSSSNITICDPLYDVIKAHQIDAICCELNIISPTIASFVTRTKQHY